MELGEYVVDQDGWWDSEGVLHEWPDEYKGYITHPDGTRADDVLITAFRIVDGEPIFSDRPPMQTVSDVYGNWHGRLDAGKYLFTFYKDGNRYLEVEREVGT